MSRPFKTRSKYGAKRTAGYASKREAEYAHSLSLRKEATNGDVAYWLEQVGIKLSIGRYVVDFMVVKRDGTCHFVEVKGAQTAVYKLKMLALKNERPEIWENLTVVG